MHMFFRRQNPERCMALTMVSGLNKTGLCKKKMVGLVEKRPAGRFKDSGNGTGFRGRSVHGMQS